ncbi:MAG: hypothetical protein Q7O66_19140 [Dehalococcoidia bacterium]|nr:hypothetical protein [Dehalococcoidia bacterium]
MQASRPASVCGMFGGPLTTGGVVGVTGGLVAVGAAAAVVAVGAAAATVAVGAAAAVVAVGAAVVGEAAGAVVTATVATAAGRVGEAATVGVEGGRVAVAATEVAVGVAAVWSQPAARKVVPKARAMMAHPAIFLRIIRYTSCYSNARLVPGRSLSADGASIAGQLPTVPGALRIVLDREPSPSNCQPGYTANCLPKMEPSWERFSPLKTVTRFTRASSSPVRDAFTITHIEQNCKYFISQWNANIGEESSSLVAALSPILYTIR